MPLIDLITHLKDSSNSFFQAKLMKPQKIIADFQSLFIKRKTQLLVLMKDNSVIREREKALVTNQLQTVFFASVAHDLRTPLNSLLASNNSLISINSKDTQISSILSLQKNSILFLLSLVEDIMDFSKFQLNSFDLNSTWFKLDDVINEVFSMTEFQANIKGINLIKEIKFDQMTELCTDKKRLKQIILNLVSNALKFTYQGHVKVTATI